VTPRVEDALRPGARAARAEVASGGLRGAALLERLLSIPLCDREVWVDELLGITDLAPDVSDDVPDLPRGAVPYLPSGVEEILAVVREVPVRSDDQFVDLGSGLGRVAMLTHLLSGARAGGVEIQEPLVRGARACSAALALAADAVWFVHANAADVALDGSIFFLYAPCNGQMLGRVLRRIEDVARRRPIVVCAVALEFPGVPWLVPRTRTTSGVVSLTVYDSLVQGLSGLGSATEV
jgi:hypothetical protein